MHLYELPLVFALIGLALYAVLAGADFGAGFWQLTAGRGPQAERVRDHAHNVDGAGLGGQPRLADLRADRRLDGLPDGVRLDRLDALDPAVHRRGRDHLPRRAPMRCAPGVRRPRELRAIDVVFGALLDHHAVRARGRGRRDRLAAACRSGTRREICSRAGSTRPRS